jgi:putative lipoic acid-binding regulatory protein
MDEPLSVELLNDTHAFPCVFVFKVIGRVENGFAARVVAAVRDELAQAVDPPFKTRMTLNGRHVAVTLEPTVESAEQVLAVYRRMRTLTGLVMLL